MMKIPFTLVTIICSTIATAQNFQKDFKEAFKSGDTITQKKILNSWEKANAKDPELYTSLYNYYFNLSKQEILNLSSEKPKGEGFVIKDSLDQPAGYLGSSIHYKPKPLKEAFQIIDKGIKLHPNRLDMRFGKIYGLGLVEDWSKFTDEIIKTVNYSKINKNNWLWTNNESREDAKDFMLSSIQNYQLQLYNTENDALLSNMQRIALSILDIYPDHVESLSNLSITYLLNKEYDKGLEVLLKAEKINPKDYIVLSNIAHAYDLKGNKTKSIEYYEKTIQYGNEDAKEFARSKIAMLKQ